MYRKTYRKQQENLNSVTDKHLHKYTETHCSPKQQVLAEHTCQSKRVQTQKGVDAKAGPDSRMSARRCLHDGLEEGRAIRSNMSKYNSMN